MEDSAEKRDERSESERPSAVSYTHLQGVIFVGKELFETLPDVLDAKLLASALSISKAGAYQLLNRPDFPTLQVGGRKLVTKQKLALWMEQHTNKAKQAGAGKEKKADETDKV